MEILEKEIKRILTQKDYQTLLDYFSSHCMNQHTDEQTNYYIDISDQSMLQSGVSLRIRSINHRTYEFTVKSGTAVHQDGVSIKREFTIQLAKDVAEQLLSGNSIYDFIRNQPVLYQHINELGLSPEELLQLHILGELATQRHYFKIAENLEEVNLDYSRYFGQVDYELEWETENLELANDKLVQIFEQLNIHANQEVLSKRARFNYALKKRGSKD